jgi:anti-anti-sigma factor
MSTHPAFVRPNDDVTVVADETGTLELRTVVADAVCATLLVRGEMDLANADLLTAVLDNQVGLGRRFIRLELSRLSFLDCAGLRAIVHAHNRCLAVRGTLILTGVTPRMALLLRITHLEEALLVADGLHRSAHTASASI